MMRCMIFSLSWFLTLSPGVALKAPSLDIEFWVQLQPNVVWIHLPVVLCTVGDTGEGRNERKELEQREKEVAKWKYVEGKSESHLEARSMNVSNSFLFDCQPMVESHSWLYPKALTGCQYKYIIQWMYWLHIFFSQVRRIRRIFFWSRERERERERGRRGEEQEA